MLYGVLYLVLQSEQHALLAGSLLVFAKIGGRHAADAPRQVGVDERLTRCATASASDWQR